LRNPDNKVFLHQPAETCRDLRQLAATASTCGILQRSLHETETHNFLPLVIIPRPHSRQIQCQPRSASSSRFSSSKEAASSPTSSTSKHWKPTGRPNLCRPFSRTGQIIHFAAGDRIWPPNWRPNRWPNSIWEAQKGATFALF